MKHYGIVDQRYEDYIEGLTPPSEGVVAELEAQCELQGIPYIGRVEGQFLYTFALATKAKDILEVGTAIGYSAVWLSMAAQKHDGRVVTLEKDPSRAALAEAYLRQAGLAGVCAVRVGEAITLLRGMEESFDLVFLDILTQFNNPHDALEMLDLAVRRLRPGGVLLSDNALRSGEVLSPEGKQPSSQGIAAFNEAIMSHPRLVSTIIPLRDGISMSVKTS